MFVANLKELKDNLWFLEYLYESETLTILMDSTISNTGTEQQ